MSFYQDAHYQDLSQGKEPMTADEEKGKEIKAAKQYLSAIKQAELDEFAKNNIVIIQ